MVFISDEWGGRRKGVGKKQHSLTLHDISFFLVDLTWDGAPGAPPYKKASKRHFWGQINQ